MSRDHGLGVTFAVCNSRLNLEGLLAESDLRQGLLYPFAMCLLDFDPESMNYSCFLGDKSDAVMHFDLMKNNMAAINNTKQ